MRYYLVYITTKDEKEAVKICEALLKIRAVACCNIVPVIKSYYWWKGKICKDSESLILAKTKKSKINEIIGLVKEFHSYEVPDITALEIVEGSKDYLKWISEEVERGEGK